MHRRTRNGRDDDPLGSDGLIGRVGTGLISKISDEFEYRGGVGMPHTDRDGSADSGKSFGDRCPDGAGTEHGHGF
jgi:hypothetical protein